MYIREGVSVGAARVNVQLSHPNLYRSIMVFALTYVGLGLNFIFTNPTFNPYGIPKEITGSIFLFLGLAKIIFLNLIHNLKIVRALMSLQIVFIVFWGTGTSITFFQGKTSLQLFVLYAGLGFLEYFQLQEPYWNPLTGTKKEVKQNG